MSAQINYTLAQGGLKGQTLSQDGVSGLIFYGTAPGSFATTASQQVTSLADAVTKGIANDYADETKATGTYLITTKGNTADTISLTVTEPTPNGGTKSVPLGTYTVGSSDTTIALQGAAWAAVINAGTYSHGYTASFTTATLTVTARQGLGIALNTGTPLAVTLTGAFAGTLTQFSSGAYSKKSLWYYHISEFFRVNPNGILWVGIYSTVNAFADLNTLRTASNGTIRKYGIFDITVTSAATLASNTTAMQSLAAAWTTSPYYCPANIIYAPNIAAITDLTTLVNGQSYSNYWVQVCIGQDGTGAGASLYTNTGVSVTCLGAQLGIASLAAVSQDMGEVGAFNITNGIELVTPAFSNGTLVRSVSQSTKDQLDAYRYTYLTYYTNYAGTYISDDWTYCAQTSDYLRFSRGQVIGKAIRITYAGMLPLLKSRLYLNADGTLTTRTIEQFDTAIRSQLVVLTSGAAPDASGFAINIPANQNVLSTNAVAVTIGIQPVGIASTINVTIGFVPKLN